MAHIFNHRRRLPDHRDLYDDSAPNAIGLEALPQSYDIWEFFPEIPRWDQGQQGSCGAHARSRASQKLAMDLGRTFKAPDRESPAFAYYTTRQLMGTTSQDSGVDNRSLFQSLKQYGYVHEADMPYNPEDFTDAPDEKAYADGEKLEGSTYRFVTPGHGNMRTLLASGTPIVAAFNVPDYFEEESVWDPATSYLRIPAGVPDFHNYIGGHDVCLTGYDYSMKEFAAPVFIADNSWGEDWGLAFKAPSGNTGRFAMDARWFANGLAYDLVVITKES